ncbi:MAG: hypothetical protein QF719_02245 [Chloroflexota bacterium]|nr:hypothetical protein [Chloroflexota bacterium]MDP6508161.1 hypothetical protein [Chloroflexota bacterium]MDP6757024.1 hypothetical protein [Chloroflexota bacterium]
MPVHIRWRSEEREMPNGRTRQVRVAWVVHQPDADDDSEVRFLAYMGSNPIVTAQFKLEFQTLYPEIAVDWDALAEEIGRPQTDINVLSYDELAARIRAILGEYGLLLDRLDYRLGRGWTRPLRDIARLLRDPGVTARFERTSGSTFAYFREHHPEYAYALYKVRLLLTAGDAALSELEAREPAMEPGARFRDFREFCLAKLAAELDGG